MRRDDDTDIVRQGLRDRILDLCRDLLPDGRRQGRLWVSNNPVTGDYKKTPELKVALDRDKGAWKCWRSGDAGDALKLIMYVKGCDFRGAMDYSRDFLGLRSMSVEQRRDFAARAQARAITEQDRAKKADEWARRSAERLFLEGRALGSGAAAEHHACAYLRQRNCPLEQIETLDRTSFRFHPQAEYWTRAEWKTGPDGRKQKTADGPTYPAILSALRAPTGQTVAVHVTFLDPQEPAKAPESPPKLMRGPAKGAVIRVSDGPERLPPEHARVPQILVLTEGVETALSAALALPEARVWCAGSLSNMANAPVWLDCVGQIVLAGENDWQNAQALAQFDRVVEALAHHGKPITVMRAHFGSDLNDLLTGKGQ